jgi:perosamine synthetase
MMLQFKDEIHFIKHLYGNKEFVSLHEPFFGGNEKKYVLEAIDSTFVSSVGKFVDRFEAMICDYTGAKYAVAVVNGTAALHMSLMLAGVERNDLVITQALSFIATCNAISYIDAQPAFIDIDKKTLGMSASALESFLANVEVKNGKAIHVQTGKRIGACVPMHTFGFPSEIDLIVSLCSKYNIPVVEDAAESLGSTYKGKYTGTFGLLGTYSFNGNKTITCGGGGMIVTNDEALAKKVKHLTTQAKVPHRWKYVHDHIGYNYRCPNLNAALACAQLEQLEGFIENKRNIAEEYKKYFANIEGVEYIEEPENTRANYNGVMTRPVWSLLHRLEMFKECIHDELLNSIDIESRLVNIPSSVITN